MIRPIALNRKNALFAGHDEGGIAWGRIATLTAIANGHPQSRLDDLLPWNVNPSS